MTLSRRWSKFWVCCTTWRFAAACACSALGTAGAVDGGLRTTCVGGGVRGRRSSAGAATRVSGRTLVPGGAGSTAGGDCGVGEFPRDPGTGGAGFSGCGEGCTDGEALGCGVAVGSGVAGLLGVWQSAG